MVGLFVVVLVVLAVLDEGGDDGGGATPTPGTATTTSTGRPAGFPAAAEQSVCRTLLTTEEAEALVGRPLRQPVIEPINANCAWPIERGTPRNAELFLVVEPAEADLAAQVAEKFEGIVHRVEPLDDLGDAAVVVHRHVGVDGSGEEFAEGVYVRTGDLVVTLANGGRAIWGPDDDAVVARLRLAMSLILERIDQRL